MELETSAEELYQHAPCGYLSTLPDGTIIRANQTFLDWVKLTGADLFGRVRFQSLLTVGARMYYETHYAPLLQMQGFVNEIALEMRRSDGSVCPVVASARQVRDARGELRATRIALFDSTDRRRYERELLVARKQAEAAAGQLADADSRKNEFIALLAHELRNPLAPIRSAAEIFRRSEHVSDAIAQTATMLQRQNKLSLQRVPVDLISIVHHAVETSEPLLSDAGLTFALTVPSQSIYVSADAARLTQVMINVLNNAAKFTPRGGAVALTLELAGDGAQIRIADNGIGIETAKLSQIFDLFMQADRSFDRRGGLGIGLSLAKNLIERHDGRITAHSEGLGRGTEFVIHLPILAETPVSVSHSGASQPGQPLPPSRRVLVVDDNRDAAQMMALLLELFGHEVRRAYDGAEALEAYSAFHPDVVLLDIGLPQINGYDVARQIRLRGGRQVTLIALTGWGEDDDRRRALAAGFDHHLTKPLDHDVLIALVSGADAN